MYRLEKTFRFEAAHYLPAHEGKCKRLHGHSWIGRVVCEGPDLQGDGPATGMLLDYAEMSKALESLIEEKLDHRLLNDWIANPTSEAVAYWIYHYLKPKLPSLVEVQIEETCTCCCAYRP